MSGSPSLPPAQNGTPPARLGAIFAACGDPAFVVDAQLRVVAWNAAAEEAFGLPATQALGCPCYDLLHAESAAGRPLCSPHCELWALAQKGERIRGLDLRTPLGGAGWLNASLLPVRDADGTVVALGHLLRDVNQPRRLEQRIRNLVTASRELLVDEPVAPPPRQHRPVELSRREQEVLRLLAHGADTTEIAEFLGISPNTARNHLGAIMTKLGVHSRVEAVAYAFEAGLA